MALLVSGVCLALAGVYLVEALRYARGTMAEPGPGLYPLVVFTILFLGAVGTAVEATLQPDRGLVAWPQSAARTRLLVILGAVIGYVVTVNLLGHAVAGTLAALAILHTMGMQSRVRKAALALLAGFGSYALFDLLLKVPLPGGIW
jgi:hypothetical protein